jgi:dimethylhistidine N-methyltransferase
MVNPDENRGTGFHDFGPGWDSFRDDVLRGLRKPQKELPSKYFYDERGSHLYERICTLDEYYIPRIEVSIMEAHIGEIAELLGPNVLLIEYGCGSCVKTRILLDNLDDLAGYVPIDISREQLRQVTGGIVASYPGLEVLPICADFTGGLELPRPKQVERRRVAYFPGSTIGNFEPDAARRFLQRVVAVCGRDGALIIGVDLKKAPEVLHEAYNDSQGVTAAFNLNLLTRINRELKADFQPEYFQHYAPYNQEQGRVEMHLVSLRDQTVHLDDVTISFRRGETIWTENSYKYHLDEFAEMAAAAGFEVVRVWTDQRKWFSVQYLVNTSGAA